MENTKKTALDEQIGKCFAKALADGVFPGGAVGILYPDVSGKTYRYIKGFGKTSLLDEASPVSGETIFDLASLTKVLVTVNSVLHLVTVGKLQMADHLDDLLENIVIPKEKKQIRLEQLLSHCSGLPAHRPYYVQLMATAPEKRKNCLIQMILDEPLEYTPGNNHIYSDLGFMLLAAILESKTGKGVAEYYRKNITDILGLSDTLFYPTKEAMKSGVYAVTERCPWTNKLLYGEVHDDNCRLLGGVSGHAGLFGTVGGVLEMCDFLVNVYYGRSTVGVVSQEVLKEAVIRRPRSSWTCGFDTPSAVGSSSGKYFSQKSIGHLGFTGTSFWIDLEREITIVLLTNRVCPSRKDKRIKRFRPRLHNLVMEILLNK